MRTGTKKNSESQTGVRLMDFCKPVKCSNQSATGRLAVNFYRATVE